MKNTKGQASLLLIILSAIAIIFFAISLNWGRVSQIKNLSIVATTTTASQLGSNYASYGEMLQKTQLGGRWEYCKHNSIFGAILSLLLVIAIVIFCQSCIGLAAEIGATGISVGSAAIALSAASLVLQVAVVQPGLTRMWNRLQQDANLSTTETFLSNGLQSALQSTVTDPAMVTDYFDANTNGRSGFNIVKGAPEDTVSRLAFYNTEYLRSIKSERDTIDLTEFTTGLAAFLPKISNPITAPDLRATQDPQYNPCCVPLNDAEGNALRPDPVACPDRSPIPAACNGNLWPHGNIYPLSYQEGRADHQSSGSFLANFGIDQEVRPFVPTLPKVAESTNLFRAFWDMGDIRSGTFDLNVTPVAVDVNIPKRLMDNVTEIPTYKAAAGFCADSPAGDPVLGINWKPGKETYCQTTWPYDDCPKYNCAATATGGDCCNPADPLDSWPEDLLDDTVDRLTLFYRWGKEILRQNPAALSRALDSWYDASEGATESGGKYWLGPKCDGTNEAVCSAEGYNEGADGGVLYTIKKRLDAWASYIRPWLDNPNFANDAYWCVPSNPASVSTLERTTIQGASTWGSITSVNNCLKWYSDDDVHNGAHSVFQRCQAKIDSIKGDPVKAGRFEACKTYFDPIAVDAPKAEAYLACGAAISKIMSNAATASNYAACDAAITAKLADGGYCPSIPTAPPSPACDPVTLGVTAPVGDVGAKPVYDACTGTNFVTWVRNSKTYFSTSTGAGYSVNHGTTADYCGAPSAANTVCTTDLPDTAGMPAYDVCTGTAFKTWLQNKADSFSICTGSPLAPNFTGTPCDNLPASPLAIPDVCTDAAAYSAWLLASQQAYQGGTTMAAYCGVPGGPTLPDECNAAQTLPRSLYGPAPRYDVCDSPATWASHAGGYQTWLDNSMTGMANFQQAKFKARYDYLNQLEQRVRTSTDAIEGFSAELNTFLTGPVQALVNARNSMNATQVDSIPNSVIYGWKDPVPPKGKNREGYWHVVQASIVIPPKLPSVGTKTKGFLGSTRCYFMKDYRGLVHVEINRWDEDHDQANFANKMPIWKVSFRKPGTPDVYNPSGVCDGDPWNKIGLSTAPDTYAQLSSVWGSETSNLTKDILKGAFLIAGVPAANTPARQCYDHVMANLIPNGVKTTMCARYNRDTRTSGMGIHFEACP